jgi:hypothetical protein
VETFAELSVSEHDGVTHSTAFARPPALTTIRYCASSPAPLIETHCRRPFTVVPATATLSQPFEIYSTCRTLLNPEPATTKKRKGYASADGQLSSPLKDAKRHCGTSPPVQTVLPHSPYEAGVFLSAHHFAVPLKCANTRPSNDETNAEKLVRNRAGIDNSRSTSPTSLQSRASTSALEVPRPPYVANQAPRKFASLPRRHNVRPVSTSHDHTSLVSEDSTNLPDLICSVSSSPTYDTTSLPTTPQSLAAAISTVSPVLSFGHWSQEDWRSVMQAASHQPNELDLLATIAQTEQQASTKAGSFDSLSLCSVRQPSAGLVQ